MIAPQRVFAEPPRRRLEPVRTATKRRTRRARRRLHAPVRVVALVTVLLLLPLLGYTALTARLTSLNYALAHAEDDRTKLLAETQRLDDRIVRLRSPERLAALATALHLHDPHVYALVRVPEPQAAPKPSGIALFAWLSGR